MTADKVWLVHAVVHKMVHMAKGGQRSIAQLQGCSLLTACMDGGDAGMAFGARA